MEKIEYKTLIKIVDTYEEEACRIFKKLHAVDLENNTNIIDFGCYARFERVEWDTSDETNLCIRIYDYGYDLYCSYTMSIPSNIFFNDKEIDNWIQNLISETLKKKEEKNRREKEEIENKEKKEYERLKEKFEK